MRRCCCCSEGEGEDCRCCRCWPGGGGGRPLLLPPGRGGVGAADCCCRRCCCCGRSAVGRWRRLLPLPSGWRRGRLPGRLGWSGPQAWQRRSRPEARGLYMHTHSVLTQRRRPAPRAARRSERHSSGRGGPGGAVRHGAARARGVQAAGDHPRISTVRCSSGGGLLRARRAGQRGTSPGGGQVARCATGGPGSGSAGRGRLLWAGARWRGTPRGARARGVRAAILDTYHHPAEQCSRRPSPRGQAAGRYYTYGGVGRALGARSRQAQWELIFRVRRLVPLPG